MYGFETNASRTRILRPFSISGLARSSDVRYWLEMFPGIEKDPPLRGVGVIWSGGHPFLFVWIWAPSLVRTSVRASIGRCCIRLLPVMCKCLCFVACDEDAKVVRNLTAVPALPRFILTLDLCAVFFCDFSARISRPFLRIFMSSQLPKFVRLIVLPV